MTHHDLHAAPPSRSPAPWWIRLAFWGFLAIAGFFLVVEHGVHLFGALPYILIGVFLALHVGMHARHRHGGHRHAGSPPPPAATPAPKRPARTADRSRGGHQH
ncbi:MAG: DUF2933 domain-containing protein [Xanthomonadaceae bacterium]|nr:DUF2933 domain-containing protein [Xanthomonadaceae bacterium]